MLCVRAFKQMVDVQSHKATERLVNNQGSLRLYVLNIQELIQQETVVRDANVPKKEKKKVTGRLTHK